MRIYVLSFSSAKALASAFELLGESERVESYVIEPQLRRVRLRAPESVAESLIQRIYLDGGLSWCSRHLECELEALDEASENAQSPAYP